MPTGTGRRLRFLEAGIYGGDKHATCPETKAGSLSGVPCSRPLPGLTASLDKLCYHHGGLTLPPDKPHAFVYFVTIHNDSDRTVTLLGRKWVVLDASGTQQVIEGDRIVGEMPRLPPGEKFSYNSYHVTGSDASAQGSFHGVDENGQLFHVILPPFKMNIPRP